jgi:hypothetical protein
VSLSPLWEILKGNKFVDPLIVNELLFCSSTENVVCAEIKRQVRKSSGNIITDLFMLQVVFVDKPVR